MKAQRGASLVEVLVSTVFVLLLGTMAYAFSRAAVRSLRAQITRGAAEETVALALEAVTREVRVAGFSAAGAPLAGVVSAGSNFIEVAADLDGDGATDGSNERVAYSVNADKHELRRASGGGSPQPMAHHLAVDGFALAYFDAAGHEIPSGAPLEAADCRRIHRVDVRLRVEVPDPGGPHATMASAATAVVVLRNQ